MMTLEVQAKAFPTSIPSRISRNAATTGSGSILSSRTDDSSPGDEDDPSGLLPASQYDLRRDRFRMKPPRNFSAQDENIGVNSTILATRRGMSSSTRKRPPERSRFAGVDTSSFQPAYRPENGAYSRDSSLLNRDNESSQFVMEPPTNVVGSQGLRDYEEELLDEVLSSAHRAMKRMDRNSIQNDNRQPLRQSTSNLAMAKADLTRDYYSDLEVSPAADVSEIDKHFGRLGMSGLFSLPL